ncbi:MAG: helix-turn-helix transcriptional regulator [Bacteroidales bacterium]|nr:helix-turn-helix transcriptional regulator [Bacteroidales bacterium]
MKAQLELLMSKYNLTPAKFAEKIGVQRSSISHIISGRNKPSYDFILKILNTFEDIDALWLLTGKEVEEKAEIRADQEPKTAISENNIDLFTKQPINTNVNSQNITTETTTDYKSKQEIKTQNITQSDTNVNEIEAITILYKDGTFKYYKHG